MVLVIIFPKFKFRIDKSGRLVKVEQIINQHKKIQIHGIPYILYGLKCWGFNQERILKLQKKAMRNICSSGYLSHSEPLFKKLNVLKIYGMFKLQLLTFCFDLINNNLPAYFINMSSLLQPVIYHHNIRQKINYSVARVKHVFAKKCMRFCIPDILNKSSSLITDKFYHMLRTTNKTTGG